ncbi:MAG: Crp/Fnr family transcriptional regulator [Pseudomonadota bacterium]
MVTDCADCPLRRLEAFHAFSKPEVGFMQKFKVGELQVDAGTPILMEGSNAPQLFTVLRGLGVRYKLTPEGERQVINLVFPGDFIGLQAAVMAEMGHSVEATTGMTLCVFDRKHFWQVFKDCPERGFDITWIAAIEEHFLGETLLTLGQRSAAESVAWALVRIAQRADGLQMVEQGRLAFPFRQQDLADALGLSLVHTNKTLRRLRERQLATWSDGMLQIHDMDGLMEIAGLEPGPVPKRPLM